MSESQLKFDMAIHNTVSRIKSGHVMSYAQVARIAGYPRHARMVSKAMGRSSIPLPWYRVIRSDFTLAFKVGSDAYNRQKKLLMQEGVRFVGEKVVPVDSGSNNDLDKLLWGLPDDLPE